MRCMTSILKPKPMNNIVTVCISVVGCSGVSLLHNEHVRKKSNQ